MTSTPGIMREARTAVDDVQDRADSVAASPTDATGVVAETSDHIVRHSHSYASDKARILSRLRRIEGQVRGIERMVEDDQYCVDVLTQVSSVIAALRATGLVVLEDHIRGCVANAGQDDRDAVFDELNGAIARFVRSVS